MRDLELATIDELMDEIKSRFDDCVIVGRKLVDAEEESYAYKSGQKGDYASAVFLLKHKEWCLHKDYCGREREPEAWEEL